MRTYRHLGYRDRVTIQRMFRGGASLRKIAKRIGFNVSTVSRELGKHGVYKRKDLRPEKRMAEALELSELLSYYADKPDFVSVFRYSPKAAQAYVRFLKREAARRRIRIRPDTRRWVISKIREGWSPDQISGRSRIDGPQSVSHEWIYRMVQKDKKAGGALYKRLKRFGRRKQRLNQREYTGPGIPGRVDISKRPVAANRRSELGHLEGDFIIGKNHKAALLSVVDRMSRKTKLALLKSRKKELVQEALIRVIRELQSPKTLTLDNAREFSCHTEITRLTGVKVFFATPYRSCERGTIENTNGIIRYDLPKRTDLRRVTEKRIQALEKKYNTRPRKILGYLTANEVEASTIQPKRVAL